MRDKRAVQNMYLQIYDIMVCLSFPRTTIIVLLVLIGFVGSMMTIELTAKRTQQSAGTGSHVLVRGSSCDT